MDQPQFLAEDWAGLAKVKLDQGDPESARGRAEQVREYLQENLRLHGAHNPMRAFQFTWDVWVALGEITNADEVLALAAAVMQSYLDRNPDPSAQEMYLRQPHHAVLWAALQEKTKG